MDDPALSAVNIKLLWDEEAQIRIAAGGEIPEFVLESDAFDEPVIGSIRGFKRIHQLFFHTERHEKVLA